ncbi:AcrR family transcriptional regulator [Chitinivorax tropicus]|uniref:AcrR family transcriptional regulator n=1 Tax=Chitinivorax tropicus TaxID=714531 RepID=A0A840MJH4_9PROT|nr:TetR/AcrR family transcriptional regulator [Chitinivorax tropicus]MBB5018560.1 AcrR family transcriptional regulator [Chitinivorax tropicus]
MQNTLDKTRRDELIDAASHLFRSQGYERTTVRDLAQAVGMQSGSLFYHFKNKAEILEAVMAKGVADITAVAEFALEGVTEPKEKLRRLVTGHLTALLGSSQHALEVLLYEWHSLSTEARDRIVQLRDRYETLWQQVLDEAATAGLVHPDTTFLRKMIFGSLNWTVQWYRPDGSMSIEEMGDRMLNLILRG